MITSAIWTIRRNKRENGADKWDGGEESNKEKNSSKTKRDKNNRINLNIRVIMP